MNQVFKLMVLLSLLTANTALAISIDLARYVDKVSLQTKPQKIKTLPEIKFITIQPFHAVGLRNPFDTPSMLRARKTSKDNRYDGRAYQPNFTRVKTSLEHTSIKKMRFSGVLQQRNKIWAIITNTETGRADIVSVGQYIGLNYGRIEQITPLHIKVGEHKKNVTGAWQKVTMYLKLNQVG